MEIHIHLNHTVSRYLHVQYRHVSTGVIFLSNIDIKLNKETPPHIYF